MYYGPDDDGDGGGDGDIWGWMIGLGIFAFVLGALYGAACVTTWLR